MEAHIHAEAGYAGCEYGTRYQPGTPYASNDPGSSTTLRRYDNVMKGVLNDAKPWIIQIDLSDGGSSAQTFDFFARSWDTIPLFI